LWDPTYKDESWIAEPIELLPRLHRWIDQHYPGRGIQIGEYNFGAEGHMSGGLAQAEALGRFAEGGVKAAFYWTYPPENSPAFWAFRAYRNFDGHGGHFLEQTVAVRGGEGQTSLFFSRNAARTRAVGILLNHDPALALDATIDLGTCGALQAHNTLTFTGAPSGFAPGPRAAEEADGIRQSVAPYSITVIELELKPGPPTTSPAAIAHPTR